VLSQRRLERSKARNQKLRIVKANYSSRTPRGKNEPPVQRGRTKSTAWPNPGGGSGLLDHVPESYLFMNNESRESHAARLSLLCAFLIALELSFHRCLARTLNLHCLIDGPGIQQRRDDRSPKLAESLDDSQSQSSGGPRRGKATMPRPKRLSQKERQHWFRPSSAAQCCCCRPVDSSAMNSQPGSGQSWQTGGRQQARELGTQTPCPFSPAAQLNPGQQAKPPPPPSVLAQLPRTLIESLCRSSPKET
jgi:hypothetical protein